MFKLSRNKIIYKCYLKHLSSFRKLDELFLPNVCYLTYNQLKNIEVQMIADGILTKVRQGGDWDEEGNFFKKSIFKIDWTQWDVVYHGDLAEVPYVNLKKEWMSKVIKAQTSTKLAKESDFEISSSINRRVSGLSAETIINVIKRKYWQIDFIAEIQKIVEPQMTEPNRGDVNLEFYKDVLKRIKYRATNTLVSLKKSDGSRARYLKSQGLHSNPNGDIKSEIPRVNRLIEKGEWLPFSYDFYSHFLREDGVVPEEGRAQMKADFMPMYMTHYTSSKTRASKAASNRIHSYQKEHNCWINDVTKQQIVLTYQKISDRMEELLGKIHYSEIFLHTSTLEHIALLICCKLYPKAKFFQIYDEIFSSANIPYMEKIYELSAKIYLYLYRKYSANANANLQVNFEEEEASLNSSLNKLAAAVLSKIVPIKDNKINYDKYDNNFNLINNKYDNNNNKFNNEILDILLSDTLVRKSAELTSSSIFETHAEAEELTPIDKRTLTHANRNIGGYSLSAETKAKIKAATNRDAEYLTVLLQIKSEESYKVLTKTREKTNYIDNRLMDIFGKLSTWTLTKIRKLDQGDK